MTQKPQPNAFQSVRPRGKDMPSAPVVRKTRKTINTRFNTTPAASVKALDSKGRRNVDMAPRTKGAIAFEGHAQGAASTQKRAALKMAIS